MTDQRPVTTSRARWVAPDGTGALIFDCDGTLADTMPSHYVAWSQMVARHGIPFSEQRFYELGGVPSDRIIAILSDESGVAVDDVASMVAYKEQLYVDSIGGVRRVDEVCEVAERYHGVLPMAVASGGEREIVAHTLTAIGVDHLFDAVVGAEDTSRHKPDPDPFLEAARRLGVPPSQCVVFEDTDLGLLAASRAGMLGVDIRPWRIPS
ncbi:MAG TPA: HAD-IA family hydrolase [Ilumatobacter sp.]|nr:HAD-IA family hydrolase [Ilumatobacter sp.]